MTMDLRWARGVVTCIVGCGTICCIACQTSHYFCINLA